MILEPEKRFLSEEEKSYSHPFYWVGHPECYSPDDLEKEFIQNRTKLEIIGGVIDETLSYEYDEFAVVLYKNELYLLETSGCSCPSPGETWRIIHGPVTKAELLKEIKAGNYKGYTLPSQLEQDLIKVIEAA